MCGIVGIINHNKNINTSELSSMCNKLQLRGPDSEGIWIDDNIGFGHRRLSIIDLETGDQPMTINDEKVVIVFNGEIYNFKELRSKLIEKGYVFNTTSDTEVILKGYEEYGIDNLLNLLEGMF
ncbi:MAG: asparagine synthetase B, partial [Ignavibacteriae bacterium]|nr:asparagine synthetase B [Ignavibacteriota bacterium]